jgi:hypothetical protein
VDEEAAQREARRRNLELGEQGASGAFYIEVERERGEWDVELRPEPPERRSRLGRVADAIWKMPWP